MTKHILGAALLLLPFCMGASAQDQTATITLSGGTAEVRSVPVAPDGTVTLNGHGTLNCTSKIISADFDGETLAVVKRETCPDGLRTFPVASTLEYSIGFDRVRKYVYGVKDGKLTLLRTIEGKIMPAQSERVEWPDDKQANIGRDESFSLGTPSRITAISGGGLYKDALEGSLGDGTWTRNDGEVLDLRNVWVEPEGGLSAGAHVRLPNTKKRVRSRKAKVYVGK
jgi:hypothetical protein